MTIEPAAYRTAVLDAIRSGKDSAQKILSHVRIYFGLVHGSEEYEASYRAVDRALQALRRDGRIKYVWCIKGWVLR